MREHERRKPRRRRQVSSRCLRLARLIGFSYDHHRDAYVAPGIGNRWGPVLQARDQPQADRSDDANSGPRKGR